MNPGKTVLCLRFSALPLDSVGVPITGLPDVLTLHEIFTAVLDLGSISLQRKEEKIGHDVMLTMKHRRSACRRAKPHSDRLNSLESPQQRRPQSTAINGQGEPHRTRLNQLPLQSPDLLPTTRPPFPNSRPTQKPPTSLSNPLNSSSRAYIQRSAASRTTHKRPNFSDPKSYTEAQENVALLNARGPDHGRDSSSSSLIVEPSTADSLPDIHPPTRPPSPKGKAPLRAPPVRVPANMDRAIKVSDDPSLDPPTSLPTSNNKPPQPIDPELGLPSHPSLHSAAAPNPQLSLPWGPTHPCYPHPNPHVPLSSPLHHSTRIIRIPRTYLPSGDLAPTFSNTYPEILTPYVSEHDFRVIVSHVNEALTRAFDPWGWRNWVDALAGVATGWVWEDVGGAKVKRRVAEVEGWLEGWNRAWREGGEGVRVVGVRRTGFLSLDFEVPDPQVGVVEGEGGKENGMEREMGSGETVMVGGGDGGG